jgi:hypothetical protein
MSEQDTVTRSHPAAESGGSGRRVTRGRGVRLAGYLVGIAIVTGLVAITVWLAMAWTGGGVAADRTERAVASVPAAFERPVVSSAGLVDRSGVRVVTVAITGGGGLLDLRYQVVDPDKAAAVHDAETPPVIIDEDTGLVINSLLMGHAHSGGFKAGVTYYLIFENPGNLVERGTTVSILLGDAQLEHIVVR